MGGGLGRFRNGPVTGVLATDFVALISCGFDILGLDCATLGAEVERDSFSLRFGLAFAFLAI